MSAAAISDSGAASVSSTSSAVSSAPASPVPASAEPLPRSCRTLSDLVDSHCHIHDRDTYNFALSRQQISKKLLKKYPDYPHTPADFAPEKLISRAHQNGVSQMICIGTSVQDSLQAQAFAKEHTAEGVFWTYGVHPDEAAGVSGLTSQAKADTSNKSAIAGETNAPSVTSSAKALNPSQKTPPPWDAASPRPVAIGEIGLDYRNIIKSPSSPATRTVREAQIRLFEEMLQLASDQNLPVVFHIRNAFDDFFAVIRNFPNIKGVVHSFSDTERNLKKSLKLGFFIGVNGLSTFAPEIPLPPTERMLLETDAPFLTPRPFRGTINESAHVKDICAHISDVTGIPASEIAGRTTQNVRELFKLPNPRL